MESYKESHAGHHGRTDAVYVLTVNGIVRDVTDTERRKPEGLDFGRSAENLKWTLAKKIRALMEQDRLGHARWKEHGRKCVVDETKPVLHRREEEPVCADMSDNQKEVVDRRRRGAGGNR